MLVKMYTLQRISNINSRNTTYKIGKPFITLKDPDIFLLYFYIICLFGFGVKKPM